MCVILEIVCVWCEMPKQGSAIFLLTHGDFALQCASDNKLGDVVQAHCSFWSGGSLVSGDGADGSVCLWPKPDFLSAYSRTGGTWYLVFHRERSYPDKVNLLARVARILLKKIPPCPHRKKTFAFSFSTPLVGLSWRDQLSMIYTPATIATIHDCFPLLLALSCMLLHCKS
jgi:hypothetical protein